MIYYYEYCEHFHFTDVKTEGIALKLQEPGLRPGSILQISTE